MGFTLEYKNIQIYMGWRGEREREHYLYFCRAKTKMGFYI